MNLPIKDITIGERGRKEFKNISSLADSIMTYGLIHPIVVERREDQYYLIAGERRLRAAIIVGLNEIPVTFREDLSEIQRRELELEENLQRQDLAWTEECEMKLKLDELKREIHGHAMSGSKSQDGWGIRDTAEALSESIGKVQQDTAIAKFLRKHPKLRSEFESIPKATALRRIRKYDDDCRIQRLITSGQLKSSVELRLGSCTDLIKEVPSDSVDLIITDPPYGLVSMPTLPSTKFTFCYENDNMTFATLDVLLNDLCSELSRVLKPGSHCYFFTTFQSIALFVKHFGSANFHVNDIPLIWNKDTPMSAFSGLNYQRAYEILYFCYKREGKTGLLRSLKDAAKDVLTFKPVSKSLRQHQFEKPQALLEFLIKQSSNRGDLVLDPFAGSGSTLRAALKLNRSALGFELNEQHYNRALESLHDQKKDSG